MSFAPIAVDLQLFRAILAPDLQLTVGRELMARVADVQTGGRGTLSLAGFMLEAQLPDDVRAGQQLRLQVRDLTPERVVLEIQQDGDEPPALMAPPPPPAELPGGGRLSVSDRGARRATGTGDEVHTLALRYEAPNFGAIDMQFVLERGSLRLVLAVAPGESYDDARAHSGQLSQALTDVTGRRASVKISPRHEPVEVYA